VPTNGKSAIDVEQPPSARADASSAPKTIALLFRSTDIRPEIPLHQREPSSRLTLISSAIAANAQTMVARSD
jgi:hypothetical protein